MKNLAADVEEGEIENLSVYAGASRLPEEYIKLVAGQTPSAIDPKDMGFLIRREDIRNTRRYVEFAKLLPLSLEVVKKRLNYESIDIEGLSPEDILALNERAVAHANTWPALESGSKELARLLESFSEQFLTIGEGILALIKDVELGRRLNGTLEALTEQEQETLNVMLVDNTERQAIAAMTQYLEQSKTRTNHFIKSVAGVEAMAKAFEQGLSDELIPLVKSKMMAYKNSGKEYEREELLKTILELDERIDKLASDYSRSVGISFAGLVVGPVGLLISGGIFGSKAEKIRKEKNRLIVERQELKMQVNNADKLIELIDDLQVHFIDLQGRMLSAEVGAKQLSQVWTYIARYLNEASEELAQVNTMLELHTFALNFATVINPWRSIKNYTVQISNAFNEMVSG